MPKLPFPFIFICQHPSIGWFASKLTPKVNQILSRVRYRWYRMMNRSARSDLTGRHINNHNINIINSAKQGPHNILLITSRVFLSSCWVTVSVCVPAANSSSDGLRGPEILGPPRPRILQIPRVSTCQPLGWGWDVVASALQKVTFFFGRLGVSPRLLNTHDLEKIRLSFPVTKHGTREMDAFDSNLIGMQIFVGYWKCVPRIFALSRIPSNLITAMLQKSSRHELDLTWP